MKKRWMYILLIILILFMFVPLTVYARAGGGSSGGSGGSGGGGGSGGSGTKGDIYSFVLNMLVGYSIVFYPIVIRNKKIRKYKLNAMKDFDNTDWDYKKLVKDVEKTYFVIQKAWTENKIDMAKDYLTNELYECYKIKLEWMEINNKQNILKNIKLLNVYPIAVNDEEGNINDKVYMYIKGKMIDYIINTETKEIIDGENRSKSFIEYWLFVKDEKGKWLLNKIYQVDELGSIPFDGK